MIKKSSSLIHKTIFTHSRRGKLWITQNSVNDWKFGDIPGQDATILTGGQLNEALQDLPSFKQGEAPFLLVDVRQDFEREMQDFPSELTIEGHTYPLPRENILFADLI